VAPCIEGCSDGGGAGAWLQAAWLAWQPTSTQVIRQTPVSRHSARKTVQFQFTRHPTHSISFGFLWCWQLESDTNI